MKKSTLLVALVLAWAAFTGPADAQWYGSVDPYGYSYGTPADYGAYSAYYNPPVVITPPTYYVPPYYWSAQYLRGPYGRGYVYNAYSPYTGLYYYQYRLAPRPRWGY